MKHAQQDEWGLTVPDNNASGEIWSRYLESRELRRLTSDLWLRSARREKGQDDEIDVSVDAANLPKQNAIVHVEKDSVLLSPEYKHHLAKWVSQLGLSRMGMTDCMADTLYGFLDDGGKIFDSDGNEFVIGVDTIDGSYFHDHAFSFNTDIKRYSKVMPKRRSSKRILLRLQLFDAAWKISSLKSPQNRNAPFSCLGNSRCPLCAANGQFERTDAS